MTGPADVAAILDGAADVIERDGWYQGFFSDPGREACKVCAIGGMNVAAGRSPGDWEHDDTHAAMRRLVDHVGLKLENDDYRPGEAMVSAIGQWNDSNDRTEDEVVCALRGAAAAERVRRAAR